MALARYTDNGTLQCYPSVKELARITGLSERSIPRQIQSLLKSKVVTLTQGGGRGRANVYKINPDTVSGFRRNPDSHSVNGCPKTLTQCPINPDTVSPQLFRNSSGTVQGGRAPQKFAREVKEQIEDISKEIQRLRDFGKTVDDEALKQRLIKRRKELREQYFFS